LPVTLACLLDVNPDPESWTSLPMVLHHPEGIHVPDFAVVSSDGCHNPGMATARVDHSNPSGKVDVAFAFYVPDPDVGSTTG